MGVNPRGFSTSHIGFLKPCLACDRETDAGYFCVKCAVDLDLEAKSYLFGYWNVPLSSTFNLMEPYDMGQADRKGDMRGYTCLALDPDCDEKDCPVHGYNED